MATSGGGGGLHNEARVRGGSRANLITDHENQEAVTSREEEHRKVLQIEEERLRREREAQQLRQGVGGGSRPVSRSASRATNVSCSRLRLLLAQRLLLVCVVWCVCVQVLFDGVVGC